MSMGGLQAHMAKTVRHCLDLAMGVCYSLSYTAAIAYKMYCFYYLWLEMWREVQPYLSELDCFHTRLVVLLCGRKKMSQAAQDTGTSLLCCAKGNAGEEE